MPSPYVTNICEICEGSWLTRTKAARTCSAHCRALLREREHPNVTGKKKRDYPEEIVRRVTDLYHLGIPRKQIQASLGPGYSAQTIIKRYITDQRSPDLAEYKAAHHLVNKMRGKPSHCASCDTSNPNFRYEWANLSGDYKNIFDYVRLCVHCHRQVDARRRSNRL